MGVWPYTLLPWGIEFLCAISALIISFVSLSESVTDRRHLQRNQINGLRLLVADHIVAIDWMRLATAAGLLCQAVSMLWWGVDHPDLLNITPGPFFGALVALVVLSATLLTRRFRNLIIEFD